MRLHRVIVIAVFGLGLTGVAVGDDAYVSGLLHQSVGGATLGPIDGRRLPVRNLGSSGQDGVDIQLDSAYGGGAQIELQPLMSTPGASVRIRHRGWDGLIYGNHRLASNGDGTGVLTCDYSDMGATGVQITEQDASGAVIFTHSYSGPIVDFPLDNQIFYCPPGVTPVASVWHGKLCNSCPWITVIVFYCNGVMYTNNLVISPTLPAGTPDSPGIDAMEITGQGIDQIVVSNAELRTFDLESWGVGTAHITEECTPDAMGGCDPAVRRLPVRNLGSSGQDGIAIGLPPNNGGLSVSLAKGNCCRGHVIIMKAYDDEGQEARVSRTQTSDSSGSEILDADFSALGADGFVVTAVDAGGVVIGPPGGTAIYNGGPRPVIANLCPFGSREIWEYIPGPNPIWVFHGCIGIPTDLILPDGTTLTNVATIQVSPLNATSSFGRSVRCELLSDDDQDIYITGMTPASYVSGLLHTALGDAELGVATDRRLPVRNLGSSGQDGVEIQLRSAFGGGAEVDLEPFLSTPGAELRHKYRGWDGLIYGNHRLVSNGDGSALLTLDYSEVGATSISIEQLDANGHVISSTQYAGPIVDLPLDQVVFICPSNCIKTWRIWTGQLCYSCPIITEILYTCICPNGQNTDYTELRINPNLPPGTPDNPGFESLSITGSGLPELTVSNAHLQTFGVDVSGLGTAQLSEQCDSPVGCPPDQRTLHVDNLGSSGQDGVAFGLPPRNGGVTVETAKGNCCRGHVIIMKAYDDAGQEARISQTQTTDSSGSDILDADFSALGANGFVLTAFDSGGGVLGPPTGTAIYNGGPRPVIAHLCPVGSHEIWEYIPGPNPIWIFHGCIGIPTDLILPGGTVLTNVASIEVSPLNATGTFGRLVRCEALSDDPEGLVIEGVTVAPAICRGDGDCDGRVGFSDIDFFVAAIPDNEAGWRELYMDRHGGTAPSCPFLNNDCNGDGHVNFADIDPFVALIPSTCP